MMSEKDNDIRSLDRFKDIHPRDINWFPGHMLKAEQKLLGHLKRVDAVLEIRDARIPLASSNPLFDQKIGKKKRIILFNKTSLVNESAIQMWSRYYKKKSQPFLFIDVLHNRGVKSIIPQTMNMMCERWKCLRDKGIRPPPLRLMVVGIPNVGKSSLINKLIGRKAAGTGPVPGVTRHKEWIFLGKEIEMLDTPGILYPKIESLATGFHLAITGAIKDEIVGIKSLAKFLLKTLQNQNDTNFHSFYGLSDQKITEDYSVLMEHIGRIRGCLKKGGVDLDRVATMLLKDFRAGNLGRISFELPDLL